MTMRQFKRIAFRILPLLLTGLPGMNLSAASDAGLGTNESSWPIESVVIRENHVIAGTGTGLYRANMADQKWQRIQLPDEMPAAGKLVASKTDDQVVLLYASVHSVGSSQQISTNKLPGIFRSNDAGKTWEALWLDRYIQHFYQHTDGALYLYRFRSANDLATAPGNDVGPNELKLGPGQGHLLLSRDDGQTWQDISPEDRRGKHLGAFEGIWPDPDHPKRIYFTIATLLRSYSVRALDDAYQQWEMRPLRPPASIKTDEQFLTSAYGYSSSSRYYSMSATLGNYFEYNFNGAVMRAPFELHLPATNQVFRSSAPCLVPVEMGFLLHGQSVKVADYPDGAFFWNIHYVKPDGTRVVGDRIAPSTATNVPSAISKSDTWQIFEISPAKPYRRMLDLGKLGDFSAAGTYKVVLTYDSSRWRNPGNEDDGWLGRFASHVFTLTIKP